MLVELSASCHHEHITEHPQRHRGKAGQPHSPVDRKDVNKNDDWDQEICRKLRHDMRQRCLDAVDSLNQCVFQCAGALFKHHSQRHACQLFRTALSHLAKYGKCRLVAGGRTQGMEQHPSQPKSRNNHTAEQIVGQLLFAFHQAMYNANDDKIRCHRESDSDDCQEDA